MVGHISSQIGSNILTKKTHLEQMLKNYDIFPYLCVGDMITAIHSHISSFLLERKFFYASQKTVKLMEI